MPEKDIRNPFQSEEDAFRILVMIIAAAVIVIACAVLISTTLGAILAAIAIAIGLWRSAGWLKVMLGEPDEEDPPAP
jgi:predicted PurR-regulated permease PerM